MTVCFTTQLGAQGAACNSPGASFGVTAYQCASCGVSTVRGERTRYIFQSEPVILEVAKGSVLQPGDVIEAINSQPIMTEAGAEQFAYPPAGTSTIAVRRGNTRVQLSTTPRCGSAPLVSPDTGAAHAGPLVVVDGQIVKDLGQVDPSAIDKVDVLKGPLAEASYGERGVNGVIVITTKRPPSNRPNVTLPSRPHDEPLYVIDGIPMQRASESDVNLGSVGPRRFGFAIGCAPICTRVRARDGTEYFKFESYPPVVALTPDGPAERAGLRIGDVVTAIDGQSILSEEGAARFARGNTTDTMTVTVQRKDATVGYRLKAR